MSNQMFREDPVYAPYLSAMGRIKVATSGKCLDIPLPQSEHNFANGVQVQQFTCNGGLNQQSLIVPNF